MNDTPTVNDMPDEDFYKLAYEDAQKQINDLQHALTDSLAENVKLELIIETQKRKLDDFNEGYISIRTAKRIIKEIKEGK